MPAKGAGPMPANSMTGRYQAEMRTERIPAPLPKPLELDYPHNHAEIRRLIEPGAAAFAALRATPE